MTKKLENASNNLREVLMWVADGVAVQFYNTDVNKWVDLIHLDLGFILREQGLKLKWRKKTDAFEEAYQSYLLVPEAMSHKGLARYFWNAAMEHKDDE